MAEGPDQWPDPFERRAGRVANIAARLHCTEGQLYSMAIGVLVTWVIAANALPPVVWDARDRGDVGAPSAQSGGGEELAASPGLLTSPVGEPIPDLGTTAPFEVASGLDDLSASPSFPAFEAPGREPTDRESTRVVEGGYAATGAGTPLATAGVPDGSVAVSRMLGRPEKVVYLRLTGGGTPLELAVDASGINVNESTASLRLCVVPDKDWNVGRGNVSVADAPAYDCTTALAGARQAAGGRWSFDVQALDLEETPGVAILPGEGGAQEFQVVFRLDPAGAAAQ